MSSISDFMTQDHRACDDLLAWAEESIAKGSWDKAAEQFGKFRSETERHLAIEENSLFPAFESKTGMTMGPTQIMRSEHQQMRKVFDDIAQNIAAQDKDGCLGLTETLMVLMQQHNMKEEQVLYRMMDQSLGNEAASLLERAGAAA
jgi:hemerythrin-like domain-containing protein